jgi:hypothetical protein
MPRFAKHVQGDRPAHSSRCLAEGERAEILELTLGLMGHPRAINPDVPVVKRLREASSYRFD